MVADVVLGFAAGLLIAAVTAPVGVSGAVFLLPVQLGILAVPNPAVRSTNLFDKVIAGPGALLRYRRNGQFAGALTRQLSRAPAGHQGRRPTTRLHREESPS